MPCFEILVRYDALASLSVFVEAATVDDAKEAVQKVIMECGNDSDRLAAHYKERWELVDQDMTIVDVSIYDEAIGLAADASRDATRP